ncbi:MAG: C25 family cysteine peptidase [Saprospiraceae bacterium]
MKKGLILFCFLIISCFVNAQMVIGTDTLYGNEWINHSQTYLKIEISSDGIYRLDGQTLSNSGVPIAGIQGSNYQVFHLGEEIPIRTSTNNSFGNSDYIEFFGERNRSWLDSFLFEHPSQDLLNPYYSLFTDTSAYYVTWNPSAAGLRFQNVTNNLTSPPTKEDYFWYDKIDEYHNAHIKKRKDGYKYDSKFEIEGFAGSLSNNKTQNVAIPNLFTGGPNSSLTIRMAVGEDGQHQQLVKIDGTTYVDESFYGFQFKEYNLPLTTASLGNLVEVKTENTFDNRDKSAISFIKITYPRTFNFENTDYFDFYIKANNTSTYLEIDDFNASNANPILYDLTNQIYINATYDAASSKVKVVLPPSTQKRHLILVNSVSGYQNVLTLQATNFINFAQLDHDYIIISNSRLFSDPTSGVNHVQEYADYRASALGGNYSSIVVDIKDLEEQFTYGIRRTPVSIRNFGHFIKKNWTNPKYVFIIGKAIEYKYLRTNAGLANYYSSYFLPTHGFLGSDNLLLSFPNTNIPIIPIGRLAALSPNEVRIYLDKVKKHEDNQSLSQTIEDKSWMKRVVHLGGGDPSIQNTIKNSLRTFGTELENSEYGAEVITFLKTSSDPIQISQTQRLTNTINDGVSIMTFFGHSYAGGFDVSLDEPSFYENEGKFPLIISYGCYTGRIHASFRGISEGFLFEENKGAIAFMSANGFATISQLNIFGLEFYKQIGEVNYNNGIGNALLQTNQNTQSSLGEIPRSMTLHGDPAILLNTHPGADYVVDRSSVVLSPNTIDIQEDSFALSFDVVNIGSNPTLTFIGIKVTQQFPSGEFFIIKTDSIISPAFRKNITYNLPTLGENSVGLNRFFIEVDYENEVNELPSPEAESNNSLVDNNGMLGVPVFFSSSNINPIYPDNYGIVGNQNITLKAAPSNVLAKSQTYIFELDTTANFNSTFKQQTKITQNGGVIEWQPNVNYQDSTVYYWRVSPDSISTLSYTWNMSSFIYINNIDKGFNQSHYYQYQKNSYSNTRLKDNTRKIDFIDDFTDVIIKNRENSNPLDKMDFSINNELMEQFRPGVMGNAGLFIAVMDSSTIEPWSNPPGGLYGSINTHGSRSWKVFPFLTATEPDRQNVINFLENVVPSNNYVLVMTIQKNVNDSYYPELWAADSTNLGSNIFQVLESQGATQIRNTTQTGSVPYMFFYKKDIMPLHEQLANSVTDELTAVIPIAGAWDEGYVVSEKIGPAASWETLKWNAISDNNAQNDHYNLDILGVKSDDSDTLLHQNITATDTLISFINASDFPFIKLRFNSLDTVNRTSAHLDYWRVFYQGLPELAIVPNKHFTFYNDTLQQGERLDFEMGVQNISEYNVDSLLVKYTITDTDNNQSIAYQRLTPLVSDDTLHARFSFETDELKQINQLIFEINPNEDQAEQYLFNNTAIKSFYVKQDNRHPLLDVTFDGLHIMEGDITSPTPQILISLKDENPYLALNDTALFKVWIIDPAGNQRRYYNDGNTMIFYPADESNLSANNNKARLELKPNLLEDGTYQLIVQAQDRTGNSSGSIDYKVSFEIVRQSMISYVLNYPNPFTTSTQFVFTLTGHQVPDDLRIQIYTVSGRLIREITKEELGNIRIGQNRTDFRWDGTDEFGDRLANGVYLYRVIARINGEELDNFYTKASPYFTNGFGKMVLMK